MKKRVLVSLMAWAALAGPTAAHGHAGREPVATATSSAVVSASGEVEHVAQRPGSVGGHVVVEGNRLYMGMYGSGLRIFDITKPEEPTELGTWTPADSALGPVPVADAPPDAAVFDGRHLAVVNGTGRTSSPFPSQARTDHTYFLDTTDPANSTLLWSFEGPEDGESHNGDIVDSRRLWLPSGEGGENGLRIYDLNPLLQSPPAAPVAIFRGDPAAMWESSPYRRERDPGATFTHTHDITVYPDFEVGGVKRDIALLAEGGSYTAGGNTGSMFVIDITNPRAPVVLQRWLHSSEDPHKPIRYHHEAQFLHGDPRVVLVTDEDLHNGCGAGGVTALRLSEDLTQATELSEWFIANDLPAGTTFGPVCSVHVFSSHGNLAYFGSYNAGLQIVDYSNPSAPKRIGHNEQAGANSWGAEYLRDGLVYVGDFGGRGLDVFSYGGPIPDLAVLTPTLEDKGKPGQRLVTVVANQGQLASGAVAFEFRDGDRVIGRRTVPPLAPGATHPVHAPWNTGNVRGDRTITAAVDAGDRLDEANEDNNERSATIPDPGPGAGDPGLGALRVSLKVQRTRLRRAVRSGLTLRVTCSRACRGTATVRLDRRAARKLGISRKATTIGRRTLTLASKGARSLRVRVSKRARRALGRARSAKLTAVVRVTDDRGSKRVTVRRAVTLRR